MEPCEHPPAAWFRGDAAALRTRLDELGWSELREAEVVHVMSLVVERAGWDPHSWRTYMKHKSWACRLGSPHLSDVYWMAMDVLAW